MLPSAVGQCVAALVAAHGLDRMPEAHITQCRRSLLISIHNARASEGCCVAALFERSLPSLHARRWAHFPTAAILASKVYPVALSSCRLVGACGVEHRGGRRARLPGSHRRSAICGAWAYWSGDR